MLSGAEGEVAWDGGRHMAVEDPIAYALGTAELRRSLLAGAGAVPGKDPGLEEREQPVQREAE